MVSKRSTPSTTPYKEKAGGAVAGVGGVRSSEDTAPDLWWSGENAEERRDATCSADGNHNRGRGDGRKRLTAPGKIRRLQVTLYRKAKASPAYRFWSLYGEIQRADVLQEAWRRVKANAGAPGVDGISIEELGADAEVEAAWLSALHRELHARKYRPSPVRRVKIPKANGGHRPLGIPTVRDRVVQMAVYLVLMPIFEADFHPLSFGFRPKRGAHQAVEAIREALSSGKTEVVDADLTQYFDTIPHRELLRQVARRVSDGMILKLIKAWLRAPIREEDADGNGPMKANRCGTPQGGVISPLLANIYLDLLDKGVNGQGWPHPRMIRYADDLVILCRIGDGPSLKERLQRWLQAKGLSLNEKKTRIVQSRQNGFEFLGFSFRWQKARKGTPYVRIEPSPGAEQSLRDRLRELTRRNRTWKNPDAVVMELNQVVRGWGNYFGMGHFQQSFYSMNHIIAHRMRQWLWRKHGSPCGKYKRWPNSLLFQKYGLYQLPIART